MPTKVHPVKVMVFPFVMYGCESWTVKKAEHRRIDAFELCCWRRLLRVLWTLRRSNQLILKKISPEYSLEGLMLNLKFQYFGYLRWRKDPDAGKRPWCWEKLMSGGEVDDTGWYCGVYQWLYGHEFVHAPGFDDGQGSLASCSPWGRKESDRTEWLNWTELQRSVYWTDFNWLLS